MGRQDRIRRQKSETKVIGRTMVVLYMFTAAVQDATVGQRALLKTIPDQARKDDWSIARMGQAVRDVMGEDWVPTGEFAEAILAVWK